MVRAKKSGRLPRFHSSRVSNDCDMSPSVEDRSVVARRTAISPAPSCLTRAVLINAPKAASK